MQFQSTPRVSRCPTVPVRPSTYITTHPGRREKTSKLSHTPPLPSSLPPSRAHARIPPMQRRSRGGMGHASEPRWGVPPRPPPLRRQARRDRGPAKGRGEAGLAPCGGGGWGPMDIVSGRASSVADLSRGMCGKSRLRSFWVMTSSLPWRHGGRDSQEGKGACQ
jgi:hypothetical protein